MSSRQIEKECAIEIYMGDTYHEVTFTRMTTIEVDNNWGADADGNRGVYREFIGDDYAENIMVDGKPLCNDWTKDLQLEIEEKIEAWMRDNEPEDA
jgi:hypothetical protein